MATNRFGGDQPEDFMLAAIDGLQARVDGLQATLNALRATVEGYGRTHAAAVPPSRQLTAGANGAAAAGRPKKSVQQKAWTPERRKRQARIMRKRWRTGVYAGKGKAVKAEPEAT